MGPVNQKKYVNAKYATAVAAPAGEDQEAERLAGIN
jgi:hypothetical protein